MSSSELILRSQMARSIVASVNWGLPAEKHDPLRRMIEEQSRDKLNLHWSQLIVWLYDWLCLMATIDASFL